MENWSTELVNWLQEEETFIADSHSTTPLAVDKQLLGLVHLFRTNLLGLVGGSVLVRSGRLVLSVKSREALLPLFAILKFHSMFQFQTLVTIVGIDGLTISLGERWKLVYHLLSHRYGFRLEVELLADCALVPSVSTIYREAIPSEREVWDMYGVAFSGHPNLTRILSDYGFAGHPLRKDFPLVGFGEIRFNNSLGRLEVGVPELAQDYRRFRFDTPWESFSAVPVSDGDGIPPSPVVVP